MTFGGVDTFGRLRKEAPVRSGPSKIPYSFTGVRDIGNHTFSVWRVPPDEPVDPERMVSEVSRVHRLVDLVEI